MERWISAARTPFYVFTVILVIKYFGLQYLLFENANPLDGLKAGLPSVLFFTAALETLTAKSRRKLAAYLALDAVLSAAMVSVIVYFRQFGIVPTYHAFMQAHQVVDVADSILSLLQPLYLLYFADLAAFILFPAVRRMIRVSLQHSGRAAPGLAWTGALAVVAAYGFVYGSLLNELKQAERMGLVGYELHVIFTGVASAHAAPASAVPITPDAVRSVKDIELKPEPVGFGAAKHRNLIVVQLESIQNFVVGLTVGGQEITPVLNRLVRDSYYFPNFYQSVGQGNTSDAEFVMNTGFYPPAHMAASHAYGGKELPGLPRLLADLGYETMTLHTNDVSFWNRAELYPALGFRRYYDKAYFGEEDPIAFGASDEVLYEKTIPLLTELRDQGRLFYAQLIAQSSHHPFLPPETKRLIELPEEWEGTFVGNYLKMANYADRALGQFIDRLKEEGLWERSMLVVYGDHFGLSVHSLSETDRRLLEEAIGEEYGPKVVHNVPLIITIPGVTDGGLTFHRLGGQIDIMATVANLLGIPLAKHVQFGQDLLNSGENILGTRYYLPTGSFFNEQILYISGETYGEGTVIPLGASGPPPESDPFRYKDDFVRIMRLLQMNDAYLASLPDRAPSPENP